MENLDKYTVYRSKVPIKSETFFTDLYDDKGNILDYDIWREKQKIYWDRFRNERKIKNKASYKKTLYFILPIVFFSIWCFGCCFTEWVWSITEMTSSMRFVIFWFGLISAVIGWFVAYYHNTK